MTSMEEVIHPGIALVISLDTKAEHDFAYGQIRPAYLRLCDLVVMMWEGQINSS